MLISLRWLNLYLEPNVSAEEAERVLTHAGFPLESVTRLDNSDTQLDVEVTSNRGDCLSHAGIAREIAAVTDRDLALPDFTEPARHGDLADDTSLENTAPEACPLFTLQLIRGVKIGPSPAWLAALLAGVGQRPINNVVDVTNWLTFAFGQPAHVFDLRGMAGGRVVVRWANEGERLTTLDGKARTLRADELVVADGERAQSLAGVIGGADSQVTDRTADVLLEAATWSPAIVRRAARRHGVRTDASHRFERLVDPRTVEHAARRAAAMIVEVAGGELAGGGDRGVLSAGRPPEHARAVRVRLSRSRALLGYDVAAPHAISRLRRLGCDTVQADPDAIDCTIPAWRPDLEREVDLIEEIARTAGFDRIPLSDRVCIVVRPPQASEVAAREIAGVLTGLGFYETATISMIREDHAAMFLHGGASPILLHQRRAAEPALRPSVVPSLLACRRANQDARVEVEGGVRLFETSQVFSQGEHARGEHVAGEQRVLALVMDVPDAAKGKPLTAEQRQGAVRCIRGVIESVARAVAGASASIAVTPAPADSAGWDAAAFGHVTLDGRHVGALGLISHAAQRLFDLDAPLAAAELLLQPLIERFPPLPRIEPLPAFPAIERDLSVVVGDTVPWSELERLTVAAGVDHFEGLSFIGAYRGKQVGEGMKSVTLRLRFRDPRRTLRSEEVDGQVTQVLDALGRGVGANLRA